MKELLLLPALLAAFIPSSAHAKPGHLDPAFGHRGKAITLLGPAPRALEEPRAWIAWAPQERIVAEVDNKLLEYLPDGRLNRDFGNRGEIPIEAPSGTTLDIVGMKVDSRGRILVARTATPSDLTASVFVARYLPGGHPDRSFGDDGTVITDLSLPAPPPPANKALVPIPTVTEPVVEASGLAVDATGRPLLTGRWISGYQDCYPFITETRKDSGYLARLGVDGSIDASFGGAGVVSPNPSEELQFSPLADGAGVLSVGSQVNCLRGDPLGLEGARVGKNGRLDQSFGTGGRIALGRWFDVPALARDRSGRLLLLASRRETEQRPLLMRLRSDGSRDHHFGNGKGVELPIESSAWEGALASDSRGRPIFASSEGDSELGWWLSLGRRRSDGTVDRSFGRRGKVRTRFPGKIHAQQILVGNGKILVGGTVFRGGKYGIGLTRYLGR
jgi:uncharacterized delta-60 repeat protein